MAYPQEKRRSRCDLLIVDDEEDIQFILAETIQDAIPEMKIEFAKDGGDALSKIESLRPRFVWTCLRMPRMGG